MARSPFQREHDLNLTTGLYLRGKTQAEIAAVVGVSQQQVSKDIRTIQARWRKDSAFNLDEAKSKELDRLDTLEREYWAAWEASKNERTKARQKKNVTGATVEASMEKEQRDGNPAFLFGVMGCIKQRCKILGIEAPEKKNVELSGQVQQTTTHDMSKLSLDELLQLRTLAAKINDSESDGN